MSNVFVYIELLLRRLILHNKSRMFQCNYSFEKMIFFIEFPKIFFIFAGPETKTNIRADAHFDLSADIINYKIIH